ncbi:MAG: twin-arginine translocase TatA/TatE family subunit [Myxococcales bacterium]|jgi:sec-independent protein translocase protein TatA
MRLGFGEILVVLVLALLFFGPSKLPQLGASLGQALRGFKKGLNELNSDIDDQPAKPAEQPKSIQGETRPTAPAASTTTTAAAEPKAPAK